LLETAEELIQHLVRVAGDLHIPLLHFCQLQPELRCRLLQWNQLLR
jgi:hypothetical protein